MIIFDIMTRKNKIVRLLEKSSRNLAKRSSGKFKIQVRKTRDM